MRSLANKQTHKTRDRQTDRQTDPCRDTQTDGRTDRDGNTKRDRQIDRHTGGRADRQRDRQTLNSALLISPLAVLGQVDSRAFSHCSTVNCLIVIFVLKMSQFKSLLHPFGSLLL